MGEEGVWRGGAPGTLTGGPLSGVRVVDLGQYVAGPLAAMLLADQGADVIRIDPPGGPRWNAPANATLLRGRRNLILDLKAPQDRARAQALIATADVIVENFRPGVAARLGVGQDEMRGRNPRLVYASLPGFGADDPRAGLAAWEGVVMAAAGAYTLRPPGSAEVVAAFSPLFLGSVFAAIETGVAVTAALIARRRDGLGQWVETPLFDALFEASGGATMSTERGPRVFVDLPAGWYRCADGRFINLASAWLRHYEALARAAGRGAWIDEGLFDYERLKTDPAAGATLRAKLVELFRERPAAEWEALGRKHGSTLAMARSMAEWMAEPHAVASGTLCDVDDPVLGRTRVPGRAVRASSTRDTPSAPRRAPGADNAAILPLLDPGTRSPAPAAAADGPSGEPPLAGLKVVDFTRVLAGPVAGRLLAQLGADVVKVDSSRTDRRAMTSLPIAHDYANRGKRSIDLDLSNPAEAGVLGGLLTGADVVLQNFTLGVAERLGIDEASARERSPGVVYTYLNAFGRRGPWSNARGYAELANTATGLTERTNGEREIVSGAHSLHFDYPRWTFTDYAAGVLGAFAAVLGLHERGSSGTAPLMETSLIRATSLQQVTYLIDYASRDVPEPRGAVMGWSPLQSLYRTADGALFVGARADEGPVMVAAVGAKDLAGVEAAIAGLKTVEAAARLAAAGIAVHKAEVVGELMAPGGPADRRGLRVEDETEVFGKVVMLGPVARLSRTPLRAGRFPKAFGAETAELRAEATRT